MPRFRISHVATRVKPGHASLVTRRGRLRLARDRVPDGHGRVGEQAGVHGGPASMTRRPWSRSRGWLTVRTAVSWPTLIPSAPAVTARRPGTSPAPSAGRVGLAPLDDLVGLARVPGELDHAPELLGPEVGHRVVLVGRAEHVRHRHPRRMQCGIPVLDPQPLAVPPRPERRTVPDRIDPRDGGAELAVHHRVQSAANPTPEPASQPVPRRTPTAVTARRQPASRRRAAPAPRARRTRPPGRAAGPLPPPRTTGPSRPRLRRAERAGYRRLGRLHHGDLTAPGRGRGGEFRTHPARAHDSEPDPAEHRKSQGQGIVKAAQHALRTWARQPDRRGPGRRDQAVERDTRAGRCAAPRRPWPTRSGQPRRPRIRLAGIPHRAPPRPRPARCHRARPS